MFESYRIEDKINEEIEKHKREILGILFIASRCLILQSIEGK